MTHQHAHSHDLRVSGNGVQVALRVRVSTFILLALVAASTVVGLFALWPDYAKVAEVANRASYQAVSVGYVEGDVQSVSTCESPSQVTQPGESDQTAQPICQQLSVKLTSGEDAGHLVDVPVRGTLAASGLQVGDRVQLSSYPAEIAAHQDAATRGYVLSHGYEVSGIVRHLPLLVIAVIFVGVVIAVGRLRGFLAILALGVAAGVLLGFVLPALITGAPGLLVGIVAATAIMFVTLFFVHGLNMRTTSALIGTLAGIAIISAVSWGAVHLTRLSGLGDESSGLLSTMAAEIDFRGLLTCSILIAGLGVLNDVTITQASSVWELRAASPQMTRREIYASAMRIGRDHIASTVYTVFFAYVGAALSVLILLFLYNRPMLIMLTQEDIAVELVRTAAGSIGLVLAVPITSAVAALFVPEAVPATRSETGNPSPTSASSPLREA